NLSLGNIRPGETVAVTLEVLAGVELRDDGFRFRFPFTLDPGYHRGARTVEVEPGVGEMELPEEEFGDVILPRYQADARGLHEVGYSFALPRDAALRRFRVTGEGFSVRSELKPLAEAIKVYEAGIEGGHLATLARQYGDGIVNLSLGNIRPERF